MNWTDFKLRLRALLLRRRIESELDEELRFHLAMEARKNLDTGMGAREATRNAAVDFGGFERIKEECRDRRGLAWIEALAQDTRYALRGFLRTPAFTVTVIATIALALGLNTALFTLFDAYVLRPLAVRDPYSLYTWSNASGGDRHLSWHEFQDFQKQTRGLTEVTGTSTLLTRTDGHIMLGNLVAGNYFGMLGVNASVGRTLLPEDASAPGASPVVVLSFAAWRNKFRSDPAIVGKKIVMRGLGLEVVGVVPAEFTGMVGVPLDFWVPITLAPQLLDGPSLFGSEQPHGIRVTGRLRPDWTVRQAEAEFSAWIQHRVGDRPEAERAIKAVLRSQAGTVALDPVLLAACSPLIAGFGLVLLIACVNVANMMLSRAMARQREIGVRLAMGAGRRRLIRQLLTECVLLALPAAAVGFVLSNAAIEWGVRLAIATMPRGYAEFISLAPHAVDWRVFAFMLMAAIAAALLFGLAPALQATRASVRQAARGEFTTDFRPARLRNALAIAQVTASALFLICAALLLRANQRFQKLDYGLQTRNVIEIQVQKQMRLKAISLLTSDPGVATVAGASKAPLEGVLPWTVVAPEGSAEMFGAGYIYTSPEYFSVFQVPILRGRNFTVAEAGTGAAVAVISQHTAQVLWPGRDALGQSFRIQRERSGNGLAQRHAPVPDFTMARVIGIARDAVNGWVGYGSMDHTCIYFPRALQSPDSVLLVRVRGNGEAARLHLESALEASLPGGAEEVHTMDEILDLQLYPWRAMYWILSAVGGLALLLTLSGLYGVLSYLVTQRTKEIGIRVALGARPSRAAGIILGQSLRLALIGTAIGAVGASGLLRLLASQMDMSMFGSFDVVAFGMGSMLVLAASAVAAWFPSRRAARIEPVSALRCD
jgi:predicted permease